MWKTRYFSFLFDKLRERTKGGETGTVIYSKVKIKTLVYHVSDVSFFLNMDKRSARQEAPNNYYEVPAKKLKPNDPAVPRNPKRTNNGFGSQSEAAKAELIVSSTKIRRKGIEACKH
jgi:hypothetical protein